MVSHRLSVRAPRLRAQSKEDSLWQSLDLIFTPRDVHQRDTGDFTYPSSKVAIALKVGQG